MPFNPCGAVCDYGRRPYTTKARFFSDSDEENKIEWYPAAPGAPHLPYPSAFMSRDWCDDFYSLTGPGEVYDTSRNFNARREIPTALATHICGEEEWFKKGVPYDPTRMPVEYDPETGLPLCCDVMPDVGGLVANGSAPIRYLPYHYPTGGIVGNGTAPAYGPWIWTPTGGIVGNGTAPAYGPWIWTPTGGIVGNGTAPFTYEPEFIPTGGSVANGEAPYDLSFLVTTTGGIRANGTAPATHGYTITPTGGAVGDGSVPGSISWLIVPTGGIRGNGTAPATHGYTITPTGGAVGNGTAPSVYTPPSNSPASNTCATSYVSTLGVVYPGTLVTGGTHWRIWASAAGVLRLVNAFVTSGTLTATVFRGTSCGTLIPVFSGGLPFATPVTPMAGESIYVVVAPIGSGGSYTIVVS